MKTKVEIVAKLGRCRIEKQYDRFGSWDYVLFCNNEFIERSWEFKKLRDKMYGKKEE